MKHLSRLLRAGDPAADDPALSDHDAAALRRAVMTAARSAAAEHDAWRRPLVLAATAVLTLAMAVLAGHRAPGGESATADVPLPAAAIESPRQLQFATPGGTRIIWVFDDELDLKETMP
jgi:hypothetical protein